MRTQISTSVSERTREQADWLIRAKGYNLRELVTLGIEHLYQDVMQAEIKSIDWFVDDARQRVEAKVDGRVEQVNHIEQLACDLASEQEGTAQEIVEFWMSGDAVRPEWWDQHDTRLLTRRVEHHLNLGK